MQTSGPSPIRQDTNIAVSVPVKTAWRTGQILNATVTQIPSSNQVTLQIGNNSVDARSNTPLDVGQTLRLKVVETGDMPVLRIVSDPVKGNPATAALRNLLPRQQSLLPLLANLALVAQSAPQIGQSQDQGTAQLIQQILNQLPSSSSMTTGAGVRQALLDSGVFLESKLADQLKSGYRANLDSDLKAGLLRLFNRLLTQTSQGEMSPRATPPNSTTYDDAPPPLRGHAPQPQASVSPAPPQPSADKSAASGILGQVDAGLARIQLSQLASETSGQSPVPSWTAELPVRHQDRVDLFQVRITRDDRQSSSESEQWSVSLAFDLEKLGPIRATVTLMEQGISVALWAEHEATTAVFNQHLESLGRGIEKAGLKVRSIYCHHGSPPNDAPIRDGEALVDTSA